MVTSRRCEILFSEVSNDSRTPDGTTLKSSGVAKKVPAHGSSSVCRMPL